ncbi:HNH endonuclease [Bacillus sp. AFS073361]|uniref:HNH endonuclease n=1 Tax=Bacillus sp. AFS073361 TaxID=2033511 RepID=UPI00359C30B0
MRALPEYRGWRKEVYEKDSYTCQHCLDKTGGNLVAHHLYSWNRYPNLRFDVNNGITLCKDCHKDFHKHYGYGDNTEEQFVTWESLGR